MNSNQNLKLIKELLNNVEELKTKILEIEKNITPKKPKIEEDKIVLQSLQRGLVTLDMVDEKYQNNKVYALEAIKSSSENFRYVSSELKNDEEIVELAVSCDGELISYAQERFLKIPEIVKIAINNTPKAIRYVEEELFESLFEEEYIKSKLQQEGLNLQFFPEKYKYDKKFCDLAIASNWKAYKFCLCKDILEDRQLALKIVSNDGLMLEYLDDKFKSDFEIIITAVSNNKESKQYICNTVKERITKVFN